ncbi:restriction endonuclease subunit S [Acaryochloris marina]|uniref:restriction endonuclease subunit S n=1 Tax=Acaryochloris marina TaxID=155978 RepID=UPI001BB078F4|nr:restriction endonuclease subunit S [Acaryochloris marina]QUY40692.1 restriction endonuclease subunit S [Acaryochloris marina S15]
MSFPRYEAYKNSGVEWLGEVPEHWKTKPLWSLFNRTKRTGYSEEELLSVYRDFGVIPKSSRADNFNKPSDDLSAYQLVEVGDLAINKMKAWQGSVAISNYRGIVSPAYHVYSSQNKESSRYLHHLFRCNEYIAGYLSNSKGIRVNQWDLDPQQHSRMPILLPPISEQQQIARFLDRETARIDALIAEQERLIELLKEKRQAVISHAVTKGLDPTAPMKDSGVEWLGEVPKHWQITRIGWQCLVGNGCTPSRDNLAYWENGDYPWLNSSKVNLERVIEADQFVTEQALKECALPIVKPGTVLIAITGEGKTRGMATITEIEATINQHLAYIEHEGINLSHDFLHDWLSANYLRLRYESEGWGSTKAAITCRDLRAFSLPLPPMSEQREICRFIKKKVSLLNELVSQSKENVCLLQERRSALISAAVTGKIDVRGWQAPTNASPANC